MIKNKTTIKEIAKEIKDKGLTKESDIYFYFKKKGLIDLNILENIKMIISLNKKECIKG